MKNKALLKTGICNLQYDICLNKDEYSNTVIIQKERIIYDQIRKGFFTPLRLSFKTYII